GAIVVAASDSSATLVAAAGLPIQRLADHKAAGMSFASLAEFTRLDPGAALFEPVDILAPAALEAHLTAENAGRVKPRSVAELAARRGHGLRQAAYVIALQRLIDAMAGHKLKARRAAKSSAKAAAP